MAAFENMSPVQRAQIGVYYIPMLLTREEMTFDFGGHMLDPVRDKETICWVLSQFLYGEVTGIQVGHWLYGAPNMKAAKFLARQSLEEMQHVDNFLRMMQMMEMEPVQAHAMVRFLSTGMMGDSWAEHVCLEMAAGEGFVLVAFYALIDILDHKSSVDIMSRAVKQEERHVAFGEEQTMLAIENDPALKRRLLGLSLVSMWAVGKLAAFMQSRLPGDSPIVQQIPAFLEHTNRCAELRLERLGLLDAPLSSLGKVKRASLIAEAYATKAPDAVKGAVAFPFRALFGRKRLTDTYLADPHVVDFEPLSKNTP